MKGGFIGIIAIHVDDLLLSGSGSFVKYITQRMKEKFDVDSFGENEATYMGMQILKIKNGDFDGIVLDSNG